LILIFLQRLPCFIAKQKEFKSFAAIVLLWDYLSRFYLLFPTILPFFLSIGKFLVDRSGKVVKRYASTAEPKDIEKDILALL
jgi:hypothetical protein